MLKFPVCPENYSIFLKLKTRGFPLSQDLILSESNNLSFLQKVSQDLPVQSPCLDLSPLQKEILSEESPPDDLIHFRMYAWSVSNLPPVKLAGPEPCFDRLPDGVAGEVDVGEGVGVVVPLLLGLESVI